MYYWPRWPVCMALFSWYEYTNDFKYLNATIQWQYSAASRLAAGNPSIGVEWTGVRMQDWLWTIQYLLDSPAVGDVDKEFLWTFSLKLKSIFLGIVDYEGKWYVDPANGGQFPTQAVTDCTLINHVCVVSV